MHDNACCGRVADYVSCTRHCVRVTFSSVKEYRTIALAVAATTCANGVGKEGQTAKGSSAEYAEACATVVLSRFEGHASADVHGLSE